MTAMSIVFPLDSHSLFTLSTCWSMSWGVLSVEASSMITTWQLEQFCCTMESKFSRYLPPASLLQVGTTMQNGSYSEYDPILQACSQCWYYILLNSFCSQGRLSTRVFHFFAFSIFQAVIPAMGLIICLLYSTPCFCYCMNYYCCGLQLGVVQFCANILCYWKIIYFLISIICWTGRDSTVSLHLPYFMAMTLSRTHCGSICWHLSFSLKLRACRRVVWLQSLKK